MSTQPYEIIAAPLEIYIAPIGTAFPAIDATPSGSWDLLGTLGDQEYSEDGVTITHEETVEDFRGLGSTGVLKSFRTEEELIVSLMLADLSIEEYARRLNFQSASDTPAGSGTAGYRSVKPYKSFDVEARAVLIRGDGVSAYGSGWNTQWEIPRARMDGATELVFQKGEPAMLSITMRVMEDLNAATVADRFGTIRMQDANAT